jgi:hypothetical protein
MELELVRKANSYAIDRFGLSPIDSISVVDQSLLHLFSEEGVVLDNSRRSILVNPYAKFSIGNLFHHVFCKTYVSDICQKRTKLASGDNEQFFFDVNESAFAYGSALYLNSRFNDFYFELFPEFGHFNIPSFALDQNSAVNAGLNKIKDLLDQAGTLKVARAVNIYLARPVFKTFREGMQNILPMSYQEIVKTLSEEKWVVETVRTPKFPEKVVESARTVRDLAKIVDVPVGILRPDAYFIIDFVKDPKNHFDSELQQLMDKAGEILGKKYQDESLYDPRSHNYGQEDGRIVVEAFTHLLEIHYVNVRKYGEIEIVQNRN